MSQYQMALTFATAAHAGVVDKNGIPYIMHPLAVAEMVKGYHDDIVAAAILHDVIEDTMYTADNLLLAGFTPECVAIVSIVSRRDQDASHSRETYREFIGRIVDSGNIGALRVKQADIQHNMSRPYKGMSSSMLGERYAPALARIHAAIEAGGGW